MAVKPIYQDPFAPLLFSSEALALSDEQRHYIREILEICCSDSKFAQKAYDAIRALLTQGSVVVPTLTSLTPTSATVGSPSFTLHIHGTNFTPESTILFNDIPEPTTYVSPTEVTTGVNMDVWTAPSLPLPVVVLSKEGVPSNVLTFEFQGVGVLASPVKPSAPAKSVSSFKVSEPVASKK